MLASQSMARDWEKLAGERGQEVPSGRLSRMWQFGRLGLGVGVKTALRKAGNAVRGGNDADREQRKREFLTEQAQEMVKVLGRMKGAAMKLGQILSTDPDLVSPEFAEVLGSLQKEAPPMPWRVVQSQVEQAFDRPLTDVFSFFDPEPIGAASIGQVHRGRLSTGEEVAVKIQYPGVADSIDADLKNLKSALNLAKVAYDGERMDDYAHEFRQSLLEESDYRIEAKNLARFVDILSECEGVRVPRPFEQWTTREVLTMEFVEGLFGLGVMKKCNFVSGCKP